MTGKTGMRTGWVVQFRDQKEKQYFTPYGESEEGENAARTRFKEFKQSQYATLGFVRPVPVIGAMIETREETAAVKIEMYQGLLKNHKKRQRQIQRAIDSCQLKIKELREIIRCEK